MLEFVDSGLYFVQDENNFINPLLQVGSGSGFNEKSTGSGGPKSNGSDRIQILIPAEALMLTAYSGVSQILPVRRSGGGGGHYRLRDGHRQAGRAVCDSLGSTKGHGVVLPGTSHRY